MIDSKNEDFIKKIKERALRSLKIEEIYLNSKSYSETIKYLQKQKYLKFAYGSNFIEQRRNNEKKMDFKTFIMDC